MRETQGKENICHAESVRCYVKEKTKQNGKPEVRSWQGIEVRVSGY